MRLISEISDQEIRVKPLPFAVDEHLVVPNRGGAWCLVLAIESSQLNELWRMRLSKRDWVTTYNSGLRVDI